MSILKKIYLFVRLRFFKRTHYILKFRVFGFNEPRIAGIYTDVRHAKAYMYDHLCTEMRDPEVAGYWIEEIRA